MSKRSKEIAEKIIADVWATWEKSEYMRDIILPKIEAAVEKHIPEPHHVRDRDGDLWERMSNGRYRQLIAEGTYEQLIEWVGPLTTIQGEPLPDVTAMKARIAELTQERDAAMIHMSDWSRVQPSSHEATGNSLIDRLRGIYTVPINDGCGPLNGRMEATRRFPAMSIQLDAANRIAELEARVACVNEPFRDVDPDIGVRLTDDSFYVYDLHGSSTGPFRSWREAYRAAEGYKDWLSQQSKIRELEAELAAASREADRLRHGVPVEGDYVCPHELRTGELEAENARLRSRQGADDALPADEDWLVATFGDDKTLPLGCDWSVRFYDWSGPDLISPAGYMGERDEFSLPRTATRGDVRALVAALGAAEREDGE